MKAKKEKSEIEFEFPFVGGVRRIAPNAFFSSCVYMCEYQKDKYCIIDTSTRKRREEVISNLKKTRVGFEKMDFLFLTHTHFDHTQNALAIKKLIPKMQILIHEKGKENLKNGKSQIPKGIFLYTKIASFIGKYFLNKIIHFSDFEPVEPDIIMEGEELDLHEKYGFRKGSKIIRTSGHSSDSISIIINTYEGKYVAFVGDTMCNTILGKIKGSFADNLENLPKEWVRLYNHKPEISIFYPGHGEEISRDHLQSYFQKKKVKFREG